MNRGVDSFGGVGRLVDVRMVLHAEAQERHGGIMERAAVASSADTPDASSSTPGHISPSITPRWLKCADTTTASSGLVTPAT